MTSDLNHDLNHEYSALSTEEILNYSSSEETDDNIIIVRRNQSHDDDYKSNDDPPKDRYRIVQLTFVLIGLSPLLPWNFFITANDYWMYKYRNVNQSHNIYSDLYSSSQTSLQTYFESYLSIASNAPFLIVLLLNAVWGHTVPENIRNFGSFIAMIVILIITTVLVKVDTDKWQQTFFSLTMAIVVLLSGFAAFLQGSTTGIASAFPSKCMHALVIGQVLSGIFAAFAQILSLAGDWSPINSAFYYFLIADVTLIFSLIMYMIIHKTDYYRHYMRRINFSRRILNSFPNTLERSGNQIKTVVISIWPHAVSVMMVFWVTLALFPPVTVLVIPQHPESSQWTGKFFIPVACFLIFNLSDLVGRFAGRFCPLPITRRYLLLSLSLLRIILIPLIMLCNVHPRSHMPVLFTSDVYYIIFMTLLGVSNGYVFNNAMVHGPKYAPDDLKENAGFVLVAFVGLGLTFGAFTSNILLRLL